jgi:hypothetical protein
MAAPINNSFWKLRLKHGRSHKIKTPLELWENFIEYAEFLENNPLIEIDFRGKDAKKVELPKMRPFTKQGFSIACGYSSWEHIENMKGRSKGFQEIVTRIESIIYAQKFEGAAAGFLNPNIIARDLGLMEKLDANLKNNGGSFETPKQSLTVNGKEIVF